MRTHIKPLEDLGYLYPKSGSKGKRYTYEIVYDGQGEDGDKFIMGLVDVKTLRGQKQNFEGASRTLRGSRKSKQTIKTQ